MSSLAIDPMDRVLRRMILLSAGLHLLGMAVAAAWMAWHAPRARFIPVAVVDLVGGDALPRRPLAPPEGSRKSPPHAKAEPAPSAVPATRGKPAKTPHLRKAPVREALDTVSLAERIRRLREKRESSEQVREAVGVIRKQREARSAVRRIGERVAHRVDLSGLAPVRTQPVPSAGGGFGGAVGKTRVPPETLAYFHALDERIRENWTVPEPALAGSRNLIVQLRITIEKDGTVTNVRMEKTSGNSFFDDSVLRAITKASPLPVPPEELRGSEDHYEIGFRFFGGGETS